MKCSEKLFKTRNHESGRLLNEVQWLKTNIFLLQQNVKYASQISDADDLHVAFWLRNDDNTRYKFTKCFM